MKEDTITGRNHRVLSRDGRTTGRIVRTRTPRRWPLLLIAAPAATAVWSGWVGLGQLCGFGLVHPLPGIVPGLRIDTAVSLPVGIESYGIYAMGAWLNQATTKAATTFAKRSAIASLTLGMLGQVCFHVLNATHATKAPWPVVAIVACLPVVVLGFAAALTHLVRADAHVTARQGMQDTERATHTSGSDREPAIPEAPAVLAGSRAQCAARWLSHPDVHQILADHPGISGASLGRELGVSPRLGQRILAAIGTE